MTENDLIELIDALKRQKCEKQYIEVKKAFGGKTKKLYDTLSSFSNQNDGGTIIFGVDESAGYEVTGVYDAQDLQVQVKNAAEQMDPVVRPFFTIAEYNGKIVVSAEIPECDPENKPCFYKPAGRIRGSYVRVGDADLPMTEYEIYSYEVYKKKIRDELRTVDRATAEDFSREKLSLYFAKLKTEKPQLANQDDRRIMTLQGLMNNEKPTVAGLMLTGDYPQAFFPQLGITAMVVDGYEIGDLGASGERFIDNKRFDGTIPEMLEAALGFVRRNIKTAVTVDENGRRSDRPEYPLVAVRELILNALVHRDYSVHTENSPIRVILYRDRLVVENPGGLYGRLTISDLGKIPGDTRNPFIASNLEIMIDTENRFSGIPTIRDAMKKAGLPAPEFESIRGNFRATLFSNREPRISLKDQPGTVEDRIMLFCANPKSKEEIAGMLGIQTSYYVVSKYLRHLIDEGKIAMTIPEKPKSKFQRFYSVKN